MNRKPGDWNCRSCQHLNFSRRDSCQRCGDPRSGGGDRSEYSSFGGGRGGSSFGFTTGSDVRPGDWYCQCGAHNFASRSSCFKCGGFKEETSVGGGNLDGDVPRSRGYGYGGGGGGGGGGGRSGWKSGDWICTRTCLFIIPVDARAGRAAMSIILPAGWSASDAMRLVNLVTESS